MEDSAIDIENKGGLKHEQRKQFIRLWFMIAVFGVSFLIFVIGYYLYSFKVMLVENSQNLANGLMFIGFISSATLGAIIGSAIDSSIKD